MQSPSVAKHRGTLFLAISLNGIKQCEQKALLQNDKMQGALQNAC